MIYGRIMEETALSIGQLAYLDQAAFMLPILSYFIRVTQYRLFS